MYAILSIVSNNWRCCFSAPNIGTERQYFVWKCDILSEIWYWTFLWGFIWCLKLKIVFLRWTKNLLTPATQMSTMPSTRYIKKALGGNFKFCFEVESLFSLYDRKEIIRSMLRIHTAFSIGSWTSKRPLDEIIPKIWVNVFLIDPDKLVTVRPHWC